MLLLDAEFSLTLTLKAIILGFHSTLNKLLMRKGDMEGRCDQGKELEATVSWVR